jgi:hypothetical protein
LSGEYKYSHLSEDLHVEIQTFAPPAEAHARIAYALAEVRRFLVPVSDFINFDEIFSLPRSYLETLLTRIDRERKKKEKGLQGMLY